MKNYVVALVSFSDNNIKQFEITAENEFEAVKKAMIEFEDEKYKQIEIDFQNSEEYPTNIEGFKDYLANGDMDCSIIEVGSFINN